MSDKEFEEHKESVITALLLKPKTMHQQCTKYWGQIVRQRYDFDLCKFAITVSFRIAGF